MNGGVDGEEPSKDEHCPSTQCDATSEERERSRTPCSTATEVAERDALFHKDEREEPDADGQSHQASTLRMVKLSVRAPAQIERDLGQASPRARYSWCTRSSA